MTTKEELKKEIEEKVLRLEYDKTTSIQKAIDLILTEAEKSFNEKVKNIIDGRKMLLKNLNNQGLIRTQIKRDQYEIEINILKELLSQLEDEGVKE
jgi:phosphoenolpyruvate-protein kinase (PTS system EI component)